MLADKSPDLIGLWMQAGLCGGDWRTPLDLTAKRLGAEGIVLVRQDATTMTVSVGSNASIDFVLRCRELARRRWERPQQCYALHLGCISWASADAGCADRPAAVTVFALHAQSVDPAALQSVAAMVACSIGVKARLDAIEEAVVMKAAALDQLPIGVAIVDENVNVVEMNETCRAMISRGDGLRLMQTRLACRQRGDQAALARAVAAVLAGEGCPVVQIARSGAAEPYVVRAASAGGSSEERRCMLMIADPETGPPLANDIWRAMFDLSESELALAAGIVRKASREDRRLLPLREPKHIPA